ncbi:MAG: DUF370 domain-containing protein [Ruminococcaceae bacterium]|nr:DUF370 domain-containing protein [Oscillospiraceae bacterium]
MYIHIGAGCNVRDCDVIGFFDMDGKWDSDTTKAFLKNAEKKGKTESAGYDLPRSFVLTDDKIIFSHISTTAILGRSEK